MDARGQSSNSEGASEEDMELRRGPWTVEEDVLLVNYIAAHGEGRWNELARCAGLKRTGKSCRLRWLNYLRPDIRRGNLTPEEQFLILELHSRWGNRWAKIAQHLPGRTDNEIKNYWRTRVQKQAKQLHCDVDSQQFKDAMKYVWMPRLLERIQSSNQFNSGDFVNQHYGPSMPADPSFFNNGALLPNSIIAPECSSNATSSASGGSQIQEASTSVFTDSYFYPCNMESNSQVFHPESIYGEVMFDQPYTQGMIPDQINEQGSYLFGDAQTNSYVYSDF